jgi:hypothetical protein
MTTYSFVQYNVLEDLVYFQGTPTPGLVDLINDNKDNIPSIEAIIQHSTIGQLTLLTPSESIAIIGFLEDTPEINLSNSKNVILKIEFEDDEITGNVDIVSKNLDGTKTYITKGGWDIIIVKPPKYPTLGKCRNCLKFTFDQSNSFNFTGNIGGNWDGTWKNGQKVYSVNIPTFPTNISPAVYTDYRIFWKPNITYTGTDYNGAPINIANKDKWICVPSSSIGTINELSNTTFFHVLSGVSASCPYAPPAFPLTWYNFFGNKGYFNLQNTPLPALQYNVQEQKCPEFIPTPGVITDWGYNCGDNCCVAAPSGSIGAYATLALCTASCGPCTPPPLTGSYGFLCTPNGCIAGTANNTGSFLTQAACELSCSFNYGYNCINGNCFEGTALNTGSFDTYDQCAATCSVSYGWNCTPNCCVAGTALNTGSFATLAECQASNCCPPTSSATFCECDPDYNLITNGSFQNGSANWNAYPTTWTPGTGIVIIDSVGQNVGVGTSVNLNNDNTSSIYLTQPNVFTIGCSYSVCFQASAFATNGQAGNVAIAVGDGTFPIPPTTNLINGLTSVLTANTIILNNVTTTDLTFYFGLLPGITANAEINIDNICVTLISCPPGEEDDCIISGSIYTYETGSYSCICPEGYISNGSGSCISIENVLSPIILNSAVYPFNLSQPGSNCVFSPGVSILQPQPQNSSGNANTAAVLSNGSMIPPNIGWSQPSLYYQYNLNGQSAASLTNPSPIAGNPNIHKTQYTFDVLKAPFWTDPAPAGNPIYNNNGTFSPLGTTSQPANPQPSYVWDRWLVKRMRTVSAGTSYSGYYWDGCGTSITTPITKTYYVMISAGLEYKIKLNGVTILKTNPNLLFTTSYSPINFPEYQKQYYARIAAGPSTGLGTLPAPFYGNNPYITSAISGSWGWTNAGAGYITNGAHFQHHQFQTHRTGLSNISIYPVTLSPGCNRISIEARGGSSCGQAWLAAAIFDNTAAEIANATSINDLNITWDTSYLPDLSPNPLYPQYFYAYLSQSEPLPASYISVCPSGSVPISGSACNGCLTTGSTYAPTTIPCGDCIECTHGRLYNGYVVDKGGYLFQGRGSGGIINTGSINASTWIIPAETDWDTLITYTNGGVAPPTVIGSLGTTAGGELKDYTRDLSATCWQIPNIGAQTPTGSSGWAGTAGGERNDLGVYSGLGFEGIWWSANSSSTFPNPFQLYTRELKHFSDDVYRNIYDKNYGFSIRLVRPALAGEINGTTIYGDYIGKDGTIYDSIVIGTQVWIDKNLSETLYNDSSTVTIENNPTIWGNSMVSPIRALSCFYDNDPNNASISNGNIDPLTGECYLLPSYYVYQKCGTDEYLVQNVSGSTTTPGEVQRDSNQGCWEFTSIASGLPNYPSQTLYTGNYFTGSNYVYNDCDECNAIHTIYMKFGTKNC